MKIVMKGLAWLMIIWGSIGIAANASALYLSMTTDLEASVATNPADLPSDDSAIFVVIVFHLFLIVAGLAIKHKSKT